jgi:predicted N-acyltransferase
MQDTWQWSIVTDLNSLADNEQNSLLQSSPEQTPFLSLAFLKLLANSASVDDQSGWQSHHIAVRSLSTSDPQLPKGPLIALVPCYLKAHSYGEYVFDHAWANAYHQHALSYYPKLVCAVPFTPVTGDRALLTHEALQQGITEAKVFDYVATCKSAILEDAGASSLHVLFPTKSISSELAAQGLHQRLSVQFVWFNQHYTNFDDFLAELTSRKRRSIRKERAPFVNGDIEIRRLTGTDLSQDVLDAFYLCYQQTYLKRSGHSGYLTAAFFANLLSSMQQNVCIIAAFKDDIMIAGSLFFYNEHGLFGRYWGALEEVSGLHFECCYYQGIEFAIENKIEMFNPGTQGEHKILRGFRPTFCFSNHSMAEPAFDDAVADFVIREQAGIKRYHAQASEVLPYKQNALDDKQS